jgi:hypothetical protein
MLVWKHFLVTHLYKSIDHLFFIKENFPDRGIALSSWLRLPFDCFCNDGLLNVSAVDWTTSGQAFKAQTVVRGFAYGRDLDYFSRYTCSLPGLFVRSFTPRISKLGSNVPKLVRARLQVPSARLTKTPNANAEF